MKSHPSAAPLSDRGAATTARSGRSGRDIALSLLVLLIPLAVVVGLFRLRGGEDVVVVDPATAVRQAQSVAAFPVAPPVGLSEQWKSVSATFSRGDGGAILRVGYVTPDGGALQLIESNEKFDVLTRRELGDQIQPTGTVVLKNRQWQQFVVREGEGALVFSTPDRTLIVIGRAGPPELRELAAAVS